MRVKCISCDSSELTFHRKVENIEIYECRKCELAYTKKEKITKDSQNRQNELYSLKSYLPRSKTQKDKFEKLAYILNTKLKCGKILEVGSGFGLFSSILTNNPNYEVEALEPELPQHFLNKRSNVVIHKLDYRSFLKMCVKKYDCIIFVDVLEHFDNPHEILSRTKEIMNTNALIVIQLPNYKSLMARLCTNWSWWMVQDHKVHFSKKSIIQLLKQCGFSIIHTQTYESLYDFKKNLDGNFRFITNSVIRKVIKFSFYLIFLPLYLLFRKIGWFFGFGGLIFVIAKKNKEIRISCLH
jgi:2-polyprenyl-3-methyl-5-hydroxy-6-metoxy-1,4-benzoquinol methylase